MTLTQNSQKSLFLSNMLINQSKSCYSLLSLASLNILNSLNTSNTSNNGKRGNRINQIHRVNTNHDSRYYSMDSNRSFLTSLSQLQKNDNVDIETQENTSNKNLNQEGEIQKKSNDGNMERHSLSKNISPISTTDSNMVPFTYLGVESKKQYVEGQSLDSLLKTTINDNLLKTYTIPSILRNAKSNVNTDKNHISLIFNEFSLMSGDEAVERLMNQEKKRQGTNKGMNKDENNGENIEMHQDASRESDSQTSSDTLSSRDETTLNASVNHHIDLYNLDSESFDKYFSLNSQNHYVDKLSEGISLLRILDNILMAGHRNKFSYFSNIDTQQKRHLIHLLFRIAELRQYDNITVNMFDMIYSMKNDPRYQLKSEVKALKLTHYIFEKTFSALGRRRNGAKIKWLYNLFEQTSFKSTEALTSNNPFTTFTGTPESSIASIITAFSKAGLFQDAEDKYNLYEGNKLLSSPDCFKAIMKSYSSNIAQLQQNISTIEANIIMNNPDEFSPEHMVGVQNSLNEEQSKRLSLLNEIRLTHIRAFDTYNEYRKRTLILDVESFTISLQTFNSGKEFSDNFIDIFLDGLELSKNHDIHFPKEDHYVTLLNYLLNHEESLLLYYSQNKNSTSELITKKCQFIYDLLVKAKEEDSEFVSDNSTVGVSYLPWNLLVHMSLHLREPMSSRLFAVLTNIFCEGGDHRALSFVREGEEHFNAFQTPSICLSIVSLFEILVSQKKMTEDDLQFAINNSISVIGSLHTSTTKLKILNEFHELYSGLTIVDSSKEFLPEPLYQFCIQKLKTDNSMTDMQKLTILNKLLKIYIRDGIELKITQIIDLFTTIKLLPNEATFKIFMREFQKNPSKWMTYRRKIRNMYPKSQEYTCTAYIWTCLDAEKARKTLNYMFEKKLHVSPALIDYVVLLLSYIHDERAFDYLNKRIAFSSSNFYLLSYLKTANAIFKNFYPSKIVDNVDEHLVKKLRKVYDYLIVNGGTSLKLTQAMMNLYPNTEERRKIMNLVKYKRTVQYNKKFRPLNTRFYTMKSAEVSQGTISEEELLSKRDKQIPNEFLTMLQDLQLSERNEHETHIDIDEDEVDNDNVDSFLEDADLSYEESKNIESQFEDSENGEFGQAIYESDTTPQDEISKIDTDEDHPLNTKEESIDIEESSSDDGEESFASDETSDETSDESSDESSDEGGPQNNAKKDLL